MHPIADAICRINSTFGQGMGVAAKEAVPLGQVLERLSNRGDPLGALAQAYHGALGSVLEDPWAAAGQDYVYPHLEDARPTGFAEKMNF